MKPSFRYLNELRTKYPHLSSEDIESLSRFVEKKVLTNLDVSLMEPDKIYMVTIDTGMMPKSKAENHMKEAVEVITSTFKSKNLIPPKIIVASKSAMIHTPTIFELEAGKTYIVNVDTGMMPYPKSLNYIQGLKDLYDTGEKIGCTLHFMMKNKLIYSFKELENAIAIQYSSEASND